MNDEQYEILEKIQQCLIDEAREFEIKPIENDRKIFFKLPQKHGKYGCTIDPPINPKTPERADLYSGSVVSITFIPKAYFNFKDNKAGIFFRIMKIVIDGGKKTTRRK